MQFDKMLKYDGRDAHNLKARRAICINKGQIKIISSNNPITNFAKENI